LKQSKHRIIGVDPGLAATGWGLIERSGNGTRYLSHGCIKTKAATPRAERLFFIYQEFCKVLEEWKPELSAIELLFFGKNVTSAIPVAESRGVVCMALAQAGIGVLEFTPNAIKQGVVGQARADKEQVQMMVKLILGLKETPKPDHAADALAAAICAAHTKLTLRV
jgi:crossover junction endodeoxyribonuclease RuvC